MKANFIYIFILVVALAVVVLFVTSNKKQKVFVERITLSRRDKNPYGTYVAFQGLHDLFPQASVFVSRNEPGYWDSIEMDQSGQAFISISDYFNADESEMTKLIDFVSRGNDVFVSAKNISYAAEKIISAASNDAQEVIYPKVDLSYKDSLTLSLLEPKVTRFSYPGKNYSNSFRTLNSTTTRILGTTGNGAPYFIHMRKGAGNFYVQLAPLAFSNYFVLHKSNHQYYEQALSLLAPGTRKILWDEYYLTKRSDFSPRQKKKSWFTVLMRYPGLSAGLITAMLTLLVYVFLEMRRKQRYIPVITKPKNDSLDFVKTIGRLYYEKGDHKNLARKMTSYFLEFVRTKYKISTGILDEPFIKTLQYKTGMDEQEIRNLVSMLQYVEDAPLVTPTELSGFHKQLESFYQKA